MSRPKKTDVAYQSRAALLERCARQRATIETMRAALTIAQNALARASEVASAALRSIRSQQLPVGQVAAGTTQPKKGN